MQQRAMNSADVDTIMSYGPRFQAAICCGNET